MINIELPATWYRTRFFIGVVETLAPPLWLAHTFLTKVLRWPGSGFVATLVYLAFIPLWISLTSWYTIWKQDRRARQLGATPIPRAKGKWPGNIDIMMRFAKDLREGYILQAMGEVLDEYGVDTLNTRILWKDNVRAPGSLPMCTTKRLSRGRK